MALRAARTRSPRRGVADRGIPAGVPAHQPVRPGRHRMALCVEMRVSLREPGRGETGPRGASAARGETQRSDHRPRDVLHGHLGRGHDPTPRAAGGTARDAARPALGPTGQAGPRASSCPQPVSVPAPSAAPHGSASAWGHELVSLKFFRTLCGLGGLDRPLSCANAPIHTLKRNSTTSPSAMT